MSALSAVLSITRIGRRNYEFGRREICEIVRWLGLPDKKNKISPGSPAVATERIAPKICQG